jgi:alpha-tubulin suppressor-like RCC1 family protein
VLSIQDDTSVTAVFSKSEYELSVTTEGEGTVNINPLKESYQYGEQVSLTAKAAIGWRFDHWEGAVTGNENPISLTICDDISLIAVFTKTYNSLTMAAGMGHSLAIREDETVWAWGANYSGQLGDGTNTNRHTPVQVINLNNVVAVATRDSHTLALRDWGTIWAWGRNDFGQLGYGTTINRNTPVKVNIGRVVAIATGGDHSLALKEDGTVWTWGNNYFGQLGDGTYGGHENTMKPPLQVSNLNNVVAIAAGMGHSIALKADGTVWTWGANSSGQLGDGATYNISPTPVQVSNLTNVIAIAAGEYHSLALKADGTVWTWGSNDFGQLGDGTTINRNTPVQVNSLNNAVNIAAGWSYSVALKEDGTVWAWGRNDYGQLGDGTNEDNYIPVQVSNLNNVVAVAAGMWHSIALKEDGSIWTWGRNDSGQLGDGSSINRNTPVRVRNF